MPGGNIMFRSLIAGSIARLRGRKPEGAKPAPPHPRSPDRATRSVLRRMRWLVLLAPALAAPGAAEAAWDLFGEILFMGGRVENPGYADPNGPASARRGQIDATLALTLGARGAWERSGLEIAYSPHGEAYEESDLNHLRHGLSFSWEHRHTPRLTTRITESFTYDPRRSVADPDTGARTGVIAAGTSHVSSDFIETTTFRAGEKSTLALTLRDTERVFGADQYLDTSRQAVGLRHERTIGRRNTLATGYELARYSFQDGIAAGAAVPPPPPPPDPNQPPPDPNVPPPPPPPDPNSPDPCQILPLDPNCIIGPLAGATAAPAAPPAAGDLGANRHRAFVGWQYDVPGGLHLSVDGGYDLLAFRDLEPSRVTAPYVRSAIGWNGEKIRTRLGYEQGLEEGLGVLADAEMRRAHADTRVRFTERVSLDLAAVHDSLKSLGVAGSPAGGSLQVTRGAAVFSVRLPRDWALIASFSHDRQRSTVIGGVAPEIQSSRYAIGTSWSFD